MKMWISAGLVLAMSGVAMAQSADALPTAQPVISTGMVWAGVMVQVMIGLFIAAATIGPLVAILMPPAPESPHNDPKGGHQQYDRPVHGHGH